MNNSSINKSSFVFQCLLVVIGCSLCISEALAKSTKKFPRGCEAVGHQFVDSKLKLTPVFSDPYQAQTVFLIHNKSNQNIYMNYNKPEKVPYKTYYSSYIKHYRWVAFAVNEREMLFTCDIVKRNKTTKPIDCANVLELCEYPRAKFPMSNFGTYWIVENTSMREAVRKTIRSGLLLRW